MNAFDYNPGIYADTTWQFAVTILDRTTGEPVNLSLLTIEVKVYKQPEAGGDLAFTFSGAGTASTGSVDMTGAASGTFVLKATESQHSLVATGSYLWEARNVAVSSDKQYVANGTLYVGTPGARQTEFQVLHTYEGTIGSASLPGVIITVAGDVLVRDTYAAIRAVSSPLARTTYARAKATLGDGGEAMFIWSPSSLDRDDDWNVLKPDDLTATEPGRYVRERPAPIRKIPYAAYNPTLTHSVVFDGEAVDSYNHVPYIAPFGDRIYIAWQGNPDSTLESQTGQTIYMSDQAVADLPFPGTRYQPFLSSTYSTNPVTPDNQQAVGPLRRSPDGEELWCFWHQRGNDDSNECFLARKSGTGVDDKWTNYRLRQNTTTGALEGSSTDIEGAPDSGYSVLWNLQGVDYQLFANDGMTLSDGRFWLVCCLIEDATGFFGPTRTLSFTTLDGETWTTHGMIEDGQLDDVDSDSGTMQWEPTPSEPPSGGFLMAIRKKGSGVFERGKRVAYSWSPDLTHWFPYRLPFADIHNTRPMFNRLTREHWGLIDTSHGENRSAMAIFLSSVGDIGAPGIKISNEVDFVDGSPDTGEFVHYSDMFYDATSGKIYAAYSSGPAVTATVQKIRLTVVAQQLEDNVRYLSPCAKNSHRDDVEDHTSFFETTADGVELVIPPQAVAGAEIDLRGATGLRWRVSEVPNTVPYVIASLSNFERRFRVTLADDGGTPKLFVNGVYVSTPIDCTEWQDLLLVYDRTQGIVGCGNVYANVGMDVNLYLGNDFDSVTGTDNAGEIRVLVSECALFQHSQWTHVSAAQWLYEQMRAGLVDVVVEGGGTAGYSVIGEGTTILESRRVSSDTVGPIVYVTKGRGALDALAIVNNGDVLGRYVGRAVTAVSSENVPTFTEGGALSFLVFQSSPGPAAMGTQMRWTLCAPGSATLTNFMFADHTHGVQIGSVGTGFTAIDPAGGICPRSYSAAQLGDITHSVNTTQKRERTGVWDTTNKRPLWASGATAGSAWNLADGTAAITPA